MYSVKALMKYVWKAQRKVCKQSITAMRHPLPPNSSLTLSPSFSLSHRPLLLILTSLLHPSHPKSKFTGAPPSSPSARRCEWTDERLHLELCWDERSMGCANKLPPFAFHLRPLECKSSFDGLFRPCQFEKQRVHPVSYSPNICLFTFLKALASLHQPLEFISIHLEVLKNSHSGVSSRRVSYLQLSRANSVT